MRTYHTENRANYGRPGDENGDDPCKEPVNAEPVLDSGDRRSDLKEAKYRVKNVCESLHVSSLVRRV